MPAINRIDKQSTSSEYEEVELKVRKEGRSRAGREETRAQPHHQASFSQHGLAPDPESSSIKKPYGPPTL